jgi:hypothetical protein
MKTCSTLENSYRNDFRITFGFFNENLEQKGIVVNWIKQHGTIS